MSDTVIIFVNFLFSVNLWYITVVLSYGYEFCLTYIQGISKEELFKSNSFI